MSFTTFAFAAFLVIVFTVYWLGLSRNFKVQNAWLLAAGYVFYGWWDWRFLGLITATIVITWACALARTHRKLWATVSVVFNLLALCFFKYFNFFSDGLHRLIETFGGAIDWFTIDILLPVGISFYTFQAISYTADVYKKKIAPSRSLINFAVYISFFPQLVAGPIERASNLLPQFGKPRSWDYAEAVLGMRQILWGLFKKCVVADGIAFWVKNGFDTHLHDGSFYGNYQCLIAAVAFGLQIYGDFSGYSDIARGTARLFGIKLMDNFLYPFFSRNAIEFWHRWHRSLMQWFTEYVYIPLGGSRRRKYLNIIIIFLLSGLWHGADITFILWGTFCAVWYLVSVGCKAKKYRPWKSPAATRSDLPKCAVTFVLYCLAFVIFRAENPGEAFTMYNNLLFPGLPILAACVGAAYIIKLIHLRFNVLISAALVAWLLALCAVPETTVRYTLGFAGFVFGAIMIAAEWKSRNRHFALERMPRNKILRGLIYCALYVTVLSFSVNDGEMEFIYFQF